MTAQPASVSFVEVDLKVKENNVAHHTDEASTVALVLRRGQGFNISLKYKDPNDLKNHLVFTASTGARPDETKGTKVIFGIPEPVKRSAEAKAIWKAALNKKESSPKKGHVVITITPAADAPIGKYTLHLKRGKLNRELGTLSLLFNPWCPDDSVFLENEEERQEYVLNEHGVIYVGSNNFPQPKHWDYGQFEDNMVEICLHLLKVIPKDFKDLVGEESSLSDPIYVSRVLSGMIQNESAKGVLEGRWKGSYVQGVNPCHWSGSYSILKRWFDTGCPVKYGQSWVFAGVMCAVMRLLGIPCRVITNYVSAVDLNKNLLVDVYHPADGVTEVPRNEPLRIFHVWVEGWMKRPDLPEGCDGWQALDPTNEMLIDGVYCCGPASVKAVRKGLTNLNYDVPFVFAEVNADRVDWLVNKDGSKTVLKADTESVGQKISTKAVGSNRRRDITNEYKFKEGSDEEWSVFKFATMLNKSTRITEENSDSTLNIDSFASVVTVEKTEDAPTMPKICMKFEEVSKLVNGRAVKLNLVLNSESTEPRTLSINIQVAAKSISGSERSEIQSQLKEDTLLPGKDLSIPVVVPFSRYWKLMLNSDVMKVSAIVSDTCNDSEVYLAEKDIVLVNPPVQLKVLNEAQVGEKLYMEMFFTNTVAETLKNCTFTVSGSGLLKEQGISLPDIGLKQKLRVKACIRPYKPKQKILTVNFNCSVFRDIKATLPIYVKA